MDISDIWAAFNTIYARVTPAFVVTLSAILAFRYSRRGFHVRVQLKKLFDYLSHSPDIENFGRVAERLRLGSLVPIAAVTAVLAYLVLLGDFTYWFAVAVPGQIDAAYTPVDLIADYRSVDDLAVVALHMQRQGATGEPEHRILYAIDSRVSDMFYRFEGQQKERPIQSSDEQSLYGGFLLLWAAAVAQLAGVAFRFRWKWLGSSTFRRTLLACLILVVFAARYRLLWEWNIESRMRSEVRFVVGKLLEESNSDVRSVDPGIVEQIERARREYNYNRWWLARWFDIVTRRVWKVSHRQI